MNRPCDPLCRLNGLCRAQTPTHGTGSRRVLLPQPGHRSHQRRDPESRQRPHQRQGLINYRNIRFCDEQGRENRTVELVPDRAPLIEWAFKAYASGSWTVTQLHDELTSRGLRSLPTPKRPAKPLAVSTAYWLLTSPYYKGDVIYRGTRCKGNRPRPRPHRSLVPGSVRAHRAPVRRR